VNIVPAVESVYWWKGKMERAGEALLVVKTRRSALRRLFEVVRRHHSYIVPEIIALPIVAGHRPYLDWLKAETRVR
jgi:periplasmic divalent cation tolerance protein